MMYASPRQRFAIGVVILTLGVALVALGHLKGVILIVVGGLLMFKVVQHCLRSRNDDHESMTSEDE